MLTFTGVRRDGSAVVYCNREALRLPVIRESGWNREARHSPSGFEWGYNGSGPAELARAILMRVFPHDRAVREPRVYQAFKFQIVSCLPREAFTLTDSEVRAWREMFDDVGREAS